MATVGKQDAQSGLGVVFLVVFFKSRRAPDAPQKGAFDSGPKAGTYLNMQDGSQPPRPALCALLRPLPTDPAGSLPPSALRYLALELEL